MTDTDDSQAKLGVASALEYLRKNDHANVTEVSMSLPATGYGLLQKSEKEGYILEY